MADQRSRGGKKEGTGKQEDAQKHQPVREREGEEGTKTRPPEGQPGGPKPGHGQTRPSS
jgi:hypothetical protein